MAHALGFHQQTQLWNGGDWEGSVIFRILPSVTHLRMARHGKMAQMPLRDHLGSTEKATELPRGPGFKSKMPYIKWCFSSFGPRGLES